MLPRKRGRDENLPPNVGNSDDASNGTKQKAQTSSSASHFAVSTHTNKLISSDEKVRLDALARLHKEVEKGTKFRVFSLQILPFVTQSLFFAQIKTS